MLLGVLFRNPAPCLMFSRFFLSSFSIAALFSLASCGVDPRWGPPSSSGQAPPAQSTYPPVSQAAPEVRPVAIQTVTPPSPIFVNHRAAPVMPQRLENRVSLVNGQAVAPPHAPRAVHLAVAAGNRLQHLPYRLGGGHAKLNDTAYDCSGTVSYVLRESGLMADQMPSRGFLNFGESGPGDWITVWAKDGHVFMTIGGLRLDTGGSPRSNGPRWKAKVRKKTGFWARHIRGL